MSKFILFFALSAGVSANAQMWNGADGDGPQSEGASIRVEKCMNPGKCFSNTSDSSFTGSTDTQTVDGVVKGNENPQMGNPNGAKDTDGSNI